MNLSVPGVLMLLVGMVLVYAGVKNKHPVDVVREAIGQKATSGPLQAIDPMSQADGRSPTNRAPAEGYGQPQETFPITLPIIYPSV
jgi:hypothetical protein